MAVQINLAKIRDKYPDLVSEFVAIQQAMNTPVAVAVPTTAEAAAKQ